jgi:hypothetical protein
VLRVKGRPVVDEESHDSSDTSRATHITIDHCEGEREGERRRRGDQTR